MTAKAAAARSFQEHDVSLSRDIPHDFAAMGDPDRLREVLANLLDNASRHTPAGGRVSLSAACNDTTASVKVAATGEGIAPERLPRVFERFYRIDSRRSGALDRSGIGLAITRALVGAHGGSIRAQSAGPGSGSTFTISLPTAPEHTD